MQFGKCVSRSLPWNWGNGDFQKGGGDVWDDVSKIPVWGDVKNSTRYQEADKALKASPNMTKFVGHSLGGSVALELQKQYPQLESKPYGAPSFDPLGKDAQHSIGERKRNYVDPESVLDTSAQTSEPQKPFTP